MARSWTCEHCLFTGRFSFWQRSSEFTMPMAQRTCSSISKIEVHKRYGSAAATHSISSNIRFIAPLTHPLMTAPALPPAVVYCLIHTGINIRDPEYGWITACESQELGYLYLIEDQFDAPQPNAIADFVLPASVLRERIAGVLEQGGEIYLG